MIFQFNMIWHNMWVWKYNFKIVLKSVVYLNIRVYLHRFRLCFGWMDGWMDGWTRDINFDSSNISLFKYKNIYIVYIHYKIRAASNLHVAAYLFKSSSDINTCGNLKGWERKGYLILLKGYLILLSFFNSQVVLLVLFLWYTCTWSSFQLACE